MGELTIQTPYQLGPCGCLLEAGDEGRALFVPCYTHTAYGEVVEWWQRAERGSVPVAEGPGQAERHP